MDIQTASESHNPLDGNLFHTDFHILGCRRLQPQRPDDAHLHHPFHRRQQLQRQHIIHCHGIGTMVCFRLYQLYNDRIHATAPDEHRLSHGCQPQRDGKEHRAGCSLGHMAADKPRHSPCEQHLAGCRFGWSVHWCRLRIQGYSRKHILWNIANGWPYQHR